ncbi:MAG: VWA domain-containing protein [Rhodothermales bacterium]
MSFINSIFLFATAAAVLPVLYHLVRRMRARTVPFSSLKFLKATPKELIRKRRLKDRLLMLARAALLALLALVFARPYLPSEQLPFVDQRASESVVVLIDRSLSMRHGDTFDRALSAVRQRIETAGPDDEIAIIAFDDRVQMLSSLDADPTVHASALGMLEAGYRTTDFFPALQRAEDVLADARHDRRVVVMVSDFQEVGWSGSLADWTLQSGTIFEPVSVASGEPDNAYVEAFELATRSAAEGEAVRFDARVAAIGGAAQRSRTVSLVVDGVEVDRQQLPGRASAPVTFQQYVTREGYYQGTLSVDSDDLPDDDRFYFTDRMDGRPNVLAIDAPAETGRRPAFYLRSVFDLDEGARFGFSAAERPTVGVLDNAQVTFLSAAVTASDRSLLQRFVEEGGTLVITASEAFGAGSLSSTIEAFGMGRIEGIVEARDQLGYEVIIGEIEVRHPIFEPFRGNGRAAILRPQFRQYARLIPAEGTTVLGRFDSGDVFLAERAVGNGRVVFYASSLNTAWTDLPLDEMYVPFLYQLVRYGVGASARSNTYLVGDPVPLEGRAAETVEIRTPGDHLYRVTLDEQGRGYFRETEVPGHYAAASEAGRTLFSVNVDPQESDLRRRDAEEAYAAVAPPQDDVAVTPEEASAAALETDERSQKLWRVLLIAVLALFMVETYFANRGARKRNPTGPPLQRQPAQARGRR